MENKFDYAEILWRAWQFTWKNKFLWFLGFLTILGSESLINADLLIGQEALFEPLLPDGPPIKWLGAFWGNETAVLIIGVVIFLLWLIHFGAQAGLINAALNFGDGKSLDQKSIFQAGQQYIRKLFGLNLLLFSVFYFFAILNFLFLAEAPVLSETYWNNGLLTSDSGVRLVDASTLVCCVLIPLNLLVILIYPFAQRILVSQNQRIVASIRGGFTLLTENIARLLPFMVALFLLALLAGTFITGIGMILSTIANFIGIEPANLSDPSLFIRIVGLIGLLILMTVGGILSAFFSAVMTFIYQDCHKFSQTESTPQTVH